MSEMTGPPTEKHNAVASITVKALELIPNQFGPILEATVVMLGTNYAMDLCPL